MYWGMAFPTHLKYLEPFIRKNYKIQILVLQKISLIWYILIVDWLKTEEATQFFKIPTEIIYQKNSYVILFHNPPYAKMGQNGP